MNDTATMDPLFKDAAETTDRATTAWRRLARSKTASPADRDTAKKVVAILVAARDGRLPRGRCPLFRQVAGDAPAPGRHRHIA